MSLGFSAVGQTPLDATAPFSAPRVLLLDDTTRSNSTTAPGTPAIGGTYTQWNSTAWGISSNRLYNPNADARAALVVDFGTKSQDVTITENGTSFAHSNGVVLRGTSATNMIAASHDNTAVYVLLVTGTTYAVKSGSAHTFTSGTNYRFRATAIGNVISIYVDGTFIWSYTLTGGDITTYVGTYAGLWDNADNTERFGAIIGLDAGPPATRYTQGLGGSLSPAATLARNETKLPTGGLTPAGTLARLTGKKVIGSLTDSGTLTPVFVPGSTVYSKSVAGGFTPGGTIARGAAKLPSGGITPSATVTKLTAHTQLAGGLTPSGIASRTVAKAPSGSITPGATLARNAVKSFTGAMTPSGALTRAHGFTKAIAAAITPAATLVRNAVKALAGAMTPSATLTRGTAKTLTGAITPSGALVSVKAFLRTMTGAITPSAMLVRNAIKALSASVTPAGTLNRKAAKSFSGALTPAATAVKALARALAGTVTPSGALTRAHGFTKALAGTLTSAASLVRNAGKQLAGAMTPSAALSRKTAKSVSGGITPSGVLSRGHLFLQSLAGAITPAGTLARKLSRALAGALTPSGILSRSASKLVAGAITPSGTVTKGNMFLKSLTGRISTTPLDVVLMDSVSRVDSSSSPGTPSEVGAAYTPTAGNGFGVSGGKLYALSGIGVDKMYVDVGAPAKSFAMDSYSPDFAHLVLVPIISYIDDNNYLFGLPFSGTGGVMIYKKDAGAFTQLANGTSAAIIDGNTVRVEIRISGADVLMFINGGASVAAITLSVPDVAKYIGPTKVAIGHANATAGPVPDNLTRANNILVRTSIGQPMTSAVVITIIIGKSIAGTLTEVGTLARATAIVVGAGLAASSTLIRGTAKAVLGALAPSGAVTKGNMFLRTLTGTLSSAGALTRVRGKAFAGALAPVGALARRTARTLGASLLATGALAKGAAKVVAGVLTPAGAVVAKQFAVRLLTAEIVPSGAIRRQTAKSYSGVLTAVGAVAAVISRAGHRLLSLYRAIR